MHWRWQLLDSTADLSCTKAGAEETKGFADEDGDEDDDDEEEEEEEEEASGVDEYNEDEEDALTRAIPRATCSFSSSFCN
jgi:hypothetical protein